MFLVQENPVKSIKAVRMPFLLSSKMIFDSQAWRSIIWPVLLCSQQQPAYFTLRSECLPCAVSAKLK